jgi:hypothetical protein
MRLLFLSFFWNCLIGLLLQAPPASLPPSPGQGAPSGVGQGSALRRAHSPSPRRGGGCYQAAAVGTSLKAAAESTAAPVAEAERNPSAWELLLLHVGCGRAGGGGRR